MAKQQSGFTLFIDGILSNNPVLIQLLGMCPALAVTNSLENALFMGGAATFVVVMSNLITSILRNLIQPHVRILIFTLTISTFVTIADLVLKAYAFDVSQNLGAFIPLIIVNCMIICRAEVIAIKNKIGTSLMDAFGIGIGFTVALCMLGFVRELLGSGTLLNIPVLPESFTKDGHNWVIMILPPGAFLTLGVIVGVVNWIRDMKKGGAA